MEIFELSINESLQAGDCGCKWCTKEVGCKWCWPAGNAQLKQNQNVLVKPVAINKNVKAVR